MSVILNFITFVFIVIGSLLLSTAKKKDIWINIINKQVKDGEERCKAIKYYDNLQSYYILFGLLGLIFGIGLIVARIFA